MVTPCQPTSRAASRHDEVMLDSSRLAIAQHLSSNGRLEKVARSGHYIQFDRPDTVIQAIDAMLEAR